jgi:hypothetical protein
VSKVKDKKKEKALILFGLGCSMYRIQRECGKSITLGMLKRWDRLEQQNREKLLQSNKQKKKPPRISKKQKRKNKKAKQLDWKKRVFAGWKDTPEQAAFRRSPEYQNWRIIVLERDKYTCQHCEQTGGRLVVHHVKTFKMHIDLRLEPDNGIVLCNNCHEKLHLSRVKQPKIIKIS